MPFCKMTANLVPAGTVIVWFVAGRAGASLAATGAGGDRRKFMGKLALVYGMRLFPLEELGEVKEATVVLKNGRTARVTMHLIEGSKDEIEATFRESTEAFFEMYPEI